MTTDPLDLARRLRAFGSSRERDAADLIESQHAEIERLRAVEKAEGEVSEKVWRVVPYGNASIHGYPESEWDWCVSNDVENIEVESKARAKQIASLLNDESRLRAVEKAALAVESQYPKDDAPASIRLLRTALREKGAESQSNELTRLRAIEEAARDAEAWLIWCEAWATELAAPLRALLREKGVEK